MLAVPPSCQPAAYVPSGGSTHVTLDFSCSARVVGVRIAVPGAPAVRGVIRYGDAQTAHRCARSATALRCAANVPAGAVFRIEETLARMRLPDQAVRATLTFASGASLALPLRFVAPGDGG